MLLDNNDFSLQNPDAYKAAWKLLKVCATIVPSNIAEMSVFPLLALLTNVYLQAADGVLVPGGFGNRGVEGKILAAKYARENKIPFLGICLGMQIAVIEYARSILGLRDANSTEIDPNTKNPCVIFMPEVCVHVCLLSLFSHPPVLSKHLSD